jgi:hypothetical protein
MNTLLRSISALLIAALITATVGCTTCRPLSVESIANEPTTLFDPRKTYQVEFESGQVYSLKGDRFTVRGGFIGIQFDGESTYRYYSNQQITRLCREDISKGKTAAAIAGGAAALAGLIVGITLGAWAMHGEDRE